MTSAHTFAAHTCLLVSLLPAGPLAEGCCNPLLSVRYRPFEGSREATAKHCLPHTLCNIVVMELCDKGNLHQVRYITVSDIK